MAVSILYPLYSFSLRWRPRNSLFSCQGISKDGIWRFASWTPLGPLGPLALIFYFFCPFWTILRHSWTSLKPIYFKLPGPLGSNGAKFGHWTIWALWDLGALGPFGPFGTFGTLGPYLRLDLGPLGTFGTLGPYHIWVSWTPLGPLGPLALI